jgi:hypothetical protein
MHLEKNKLPYHNTLLYPVSGRIVKMSESLNTIKVLSYIVAIVPSIYFLYRILKEVYYSLTHNDEDIL